MQAVRLLSIIIAIIFSARILQNLVIFFFPIIGHSKETKVILLYSSMSLIYILTNMITNLIVYRYESIKKNNKINLFGGLILSISNSILILSIVISIMFHTVQINSNAIAKLNESKIFCLMYNIKKSIIDYE